MDPRCVSGGAGVFFGQTYSGWEASVGGNIYPQELTEADGTDIRLTQGVALEGGDDRGGGNRPGETDIQIVPVNGGCELTLSHKLDAEYAPYLEATASVYKDHLNTLDALLA